MDPSEMTSEDRRILGIIDPTDLEEPDPLADQIEYDDERGLKFKKTEWPEAVRAEWNARLHPSLVLPTDLHTPVKRGRGGGGKRRCPVPTAKGSKCPNFCEPRRPACHIHDPEGKFAKGNPKYRKKMIDQLKWLGIES